MTDASAGWGLGFARCLVWRSRVWARVSEVSGGLGFMGLRCRVWSFAEAGGRDFSARLSAGRVAACARPWDYAGIAPCRGLKNTESLIDLPRKAAAMLKGAVGVEPCGQSA